jgi:hypothetical protein
MGEVCFLVAVSEGMVAVSLLHAGVSLAGMESKMVGKVKPDMQGQILRKLDQADNIINVVEELLRKEYRGQPEVALVDKLIEQYRKEWS